MKIIDSTTYFEEDMMIDLRLNILNDYVAILLSLKLDFLTVEQKKKLNSI